MRQAGRIRISVHGYNQADDIDRLLSVMAKTLS
jgi:selenocysteine lyase/cysteine desulfurase